MTLVFDAVPAGTTLYIPFATYGGTNGESITLTGLAVTDIEIYKNGSTTQRASDNGYALLDTDGIDFDGITGIHGFSVDLSDNSDSGFYAAGSWYWVVVSAVTVDSQTVNFIAAVFRIVAAESTAGYPNVTIKSGTGTGEINLSSGAVVSVTTVTNLTNAPTSGDLTATMKSSVTIAATSATPTAAAVTGNVGGNVAGSIGSLAAQAKADVNAEADTALADAKAGYAAAVEAAILDEGDATALLAAIAAKVEEFLVNEGDATATLAAIAAAVRTNLATELGRIDAAISTRLAAAAYTAPLSAAQTQAECEDALIAHNLDHLVKSAVDTDFATTVHVDSVIGQLAQTADGGFSRASDSLEAVRDRGDAAWITATSVTVSDKTGFKLASDGLVSVTGWTVALTGNITGNLSGSVGSVTGAVGSVTGAVGSVTGNVGGNVAGSVGSVTGGINTSGGTITTLDSLGSALSAYGDSNWSTAAGFAVPGDQMNLADNAITDAKIITPAESVGRPAGILGMIRRVFEKMAGGNKQTRDRSTGTVTLRNAADDGNLETHTQSTSGDVDTQTKGA